ncbi:MAG: histidine phosphotransferase family protein [Magnetospirillum sp. WYHS-4]
MLVDIRAAQLLCSRLCHDLVGPVGAIGAGLELLAEASGPYGADGADGALELVKRSSGEIAKRLAFLRSAFGLGGGAASGATLAEARKLTADFLSGGNIALDWPDEAEASLGPAAAKLLLNLALLGSECLPRGGRLAIHVANLPDGLGVALVAAGPGARFRADVREVLVSQVSGDALTARNVHGHYAACLAEDMGAGIEVLEDVPGEVRLAVLLPGERG